MYFINKQLKWENKSAGSQPCTIMAQAVLVYTWLLVAFDWNGLTTKDLPQYFTMFRKQISTKSEKTKIILYFFESSNLNFFKKETNYLNFGSTIFHEVQRNKL